MTKYTGKTFVLFKLFYFYPGINLSRYLSINNGNFISQLHISYKRINSFFPDLTTKSNNVYCIAQLKTWL